MFDYIILDAETRMPVPNPERFCMDYRAELFERTDKDIKTVPKEGKYIIRFFCEGETVEEVRY